MNAPLIHLTHQTGDISRLLRGLAWELKYRRGVERAECERVYRWIIRESYRQLAEARRSQRVEGAG